MFGEIDWDYVIKRRKDNIPWRIIAKECNFNCIWLIRQARAYGLETDQSGKPNKRGKRLCVGCRKYFFKKEMKQTPRGLFCFECHKRRFGENRYEKTGYRLG